MVENPDILRSLSAAGNQRPALVVGFAAETDDVVDNAVSKRDRKGCDWIVANDVSPATGTFGGDDAGASRYRQRRGRLARAGKTDVAARLAERIAQHFQSLPEANGMSNVEIAVTRLPHNADLPLPAYETAQSAGMDLAAAIDGPVTLARGARDIFRRALRLPCLRDMKPRSAAVGLAAKNGVTVLNTPGTVDADYRGEVKVILINLGDEDFVIERGMRIAQMVIAPVTQAVFSEVESLSETDRGAGGFGSTGT